MPNGEHIILFIYRGNEHSRLDFDCLDMETMLSSTVWFRKMPHLPYFRDDSGTVSTFGTVKVFDITVAFFQFRR